MQFGGGAEKKKNHVFNKYDCRAVDIFYSKGKHVWGLPCKIDAYFSLVQKVGV